MILMTTELLKHIAIVSFFTLLASIVLALIIEGVAKLTQHEFPRTTYNICKDINDWVYKLAFVCIISLFFCGVIYIFFYDKLMSNF
jgi:chromate transport protein ChrA